MTEVTNDRSRLWGGQKDPQGQRGKRIKENAKSRETKGKNRQAQMTCTGERMTDETARLPLPAPWLSYSGHSGLCPCVELAGPLIGQESHRDSWYFFCFCFLYRCCSFVSLQSRGTS